MTEIVESRMKKERLRERSSNPVSFLSPTECEMGGVNVRLSVLESYKKCLGKANPILTSEKHAGSFNLVKTLRFSSSNES